MSILFPSSLGKDYLEIGLALSYSGDSDMGFVVLEFIRVDISMVLYFKQK